MNVLVGNASAHGCRGDPITRVVALAAIRGGWRVPISEHSARVWNAHKEGVGGSSPSAPTTSSSIRMPETGDRQIPRRASWRSATECVVHG